MGSEPHPDVTRLLTLVDELPIPPTYAMSVDSARDRFAGFFGDQPVEDVATIEDFSIPGPAGPAHGLPVRMYEPTTEPPHPVLVFFHGGGWTIGDLDTHDTICAALTNRADCLTVSVDYRLAPESPFPAAVADAYAAVEWVAEHAPQINGDPERIAVAGDSAGGNLAAVVSIMARDLDGPKIVHQGLIYPAVASPPIHEFDSYRENAEGYFLEMTSVEWFYDQYLESPVHARNGYLAPLLVDDLSGLPGATLITAEFDPLRDEGVAYGDRLTEADVPVDHLHFEGMIHAFASLPTMIDGGRVALDDLGANLKRTFTT